MSQRKSKPVQPIKADRKTKHKHAEPLTGEDLKQLYSAIRNADRILGELSIEENKAGRLAREALRARRDGKAEQAKSIVEPLFKAVADSIARPEANPERDADTGEVLTEVILPAEWRENDGVTVKDRMKRMAAYQEEGARLKSFKKFAELDEPLDLMCVPALADLLSYGRHCAESFEDSPNWVGAFVADILREVAARGPESVNAHPEDVKHFFDRAIENLRDTLDLCRRLQAKIPFSTLDEIESWNSGPISGAVTAADATA